MSSKKEYLEKLLKQYAKKNNQLILENSKNVFLEMNYEKLEKKFEIESAKNKKLNKMINKIEQVWIKTQLKLQDARNENRELREINNMLDDMNESLLTSDKPDDSVIICQLSAEYGKLIIGIQTIFFFFFLMINKKNQQKMKN